MASNERAQAVATNNDIDQFMTVFDGLLEGVIIDRHAANDALLTAFLDKPDFRETLTHPEATVTPDVPENRTDPPTPDREVEPAEETTP